MFRKDSDHVDGTCVWCLVFGTPGTGAGNGTIFVGYEEEVFSFESRIFGEFCSAYFLGPIAAHIAFHNMTPGGFVARAIGAHIVIGDLHDVGKVIEVIAEHFELWE